MEPKNRRIRKFLDKSLFLFVSVIGVSSIILLKTQHYSQIMVTAVPVICIIIYALLTSLRTRFRLRLDQAGDNCYYLGFIYTLTSLGVALYEYNTEKGSVDSVVRNFGIALVSTLVGVVLRVTLHQMREDPIDTEYSSRMELSEAASKVTGHLNSMVTDVASFRLGTQDWMKSFAFEVQQLSNEYRDSIRQIHQHTQRLSEQFEGLISKVREVDIPPDFVAKEFSTAIEFTEPLLRKVGEIAQIEDKARENFGSIIAGASQTAEAINASAGSLKEALDGLAPLGENASALVRSLGAVNDQIQELESRIRNLASASASEELRTNQEAVAANYAALGRVIDQFGRRVENIGSEIEKASEQIVQAASNLGAAKSTIVQNTQPENAPRSGGFWKRNG